MTRSEKDAPMSFPYDRNVHDLYPTADAFQIPELLPLPCISHPDPLANIDEAIKRYIHYDVRKFSMLQQPSGFPYQLISHPDKKGLGMEYFEFRSTCPTPLVRVGFPGDIWITISHGGLHEVHFKTNDSRWENWLGCQASHQSSKSSSSNFLRHPLLPSFCLWPCESKKIITWRKCNTVMYYASRIKRLGYPDPGSKNKLPLVRLGKLPTASEVVAHLYECFISESIIRRQTDSHTPKRSAKECRQSRLACRRDHSPGLYKSSTASKITLTSSQESEAVIVISDDDESDPVKSFLRDLPLPEPASAYLRYFHDNGISTEQDLDLIARSRGGILQDVVLGELKRHDRQTWVTIMAAFDKRKLRELKRHDRQIWVAIMAAFDKRKHTKKLD